MIIRLWLRLFELGETCSSDISEDMPILTIFRVLHKASEDRKLLTKVCPTRLCLFSVFTHPFSFYRSSP
jgi:hypothetical protein